MSENKIKSPIYQIIESDLRAQILDGTLKQGDLVPSETELAAKYQVTRMTVRQAINNLLIDGYIYRHKGRGTFVTFNKMEVQQNTHYFNYMNNIKGMGNNVPIKLVVISKSMIPADEILAARLQLKMGDSVHYIERLRVADNIVLAYERLYLPKNLYPNFDEIDFTISFYNYIENQLNWKVRNYSLAIEARSLTAKVADLLHHQEGEPSLYTSSVTYLDNGRAFEYTRCYLNASYFRFKFSN